MKKSFTTLLIAVSIAASAQKDTLANTLNEVIVTANKFEQKQKETGKVLTVITQEQLWRSSGRSLTEVLNEQTGIIINGSNNALGANQTVYMRGASSGNTLILIDGVPAYDASGISSEFDLNYININQVERIEILKGAQSTLYGSDAVAGVINIITKKSGSRAFGGYGTLSGGTYGTVNGAAGINGRKDKWQYDAGYSYIHSNGFSSAYDSTGNKNFDKDGYTQNTFNATVGYDVSPQFNIRAYSHVNQYKAAIDAGAFTDDKDYNITDKNLQLGTTADYKSGGNKIIFNYQYNTINRSYIDDSTDAGGVAKYQNGMYKGYSHFAELYGNFKLNDKLELLTGVDYRENKTSQSYLSISSFGPYSTALGDSAKTNQASAYASLILKNISGFTFELGGRANHHSIYGWNGTYSFNPSYNIDTNWKLFANISSAYRVPSLYQLYSEYGNKGLKPEQTQSYEGGVQYSAKKITARAVVFKRNINDVIYFYTDPATYISTYINADRQRDNGIETDASVAVSKVINISANYTYADGKIMTTSDFTGKDTAVYNLYKRPRNVFNVQANFQVTKALDFSVHLKTVSNHEEPVYADAPIKVKGYYTIDIYSEYAASKMIKLFANFNNITNRQYFDIRGYNCKRFNFMAGLRVQF